MIAEDGEPGERLLPPFPEVAEDATVVDVMRLLQERLQLLYRLVGPAQRSVGE